MAKEGLPLAKEYLEYFRARKKQGFRPKSYGIWLKQGRGAPAMQVRDKLAPSVRTKALIRGLRASNVDEKEIQNMVYGR